MGGRLVPLALLLLAGSALHEAKQKVVRSTLRDQPRLSCYVSNYRRLSGECTRNQLVCYYTRRMPRFASDFRPDDLIGRGCDVPRNREAGSCQEYTKGLDTFVRCECAMTDCNSHFWHGFATAALHHRQELNRTRKATTVGGAAPTGSYSNWFMRCFSCYILLQVYYLAEYLIKCYRFQKRAIRMRAVLVARGTQQQETIMFNLPEEKPEVTIHNFKTSIVKLIDGFIRYRSLGSLPPVDINQLRANWVLGKQELHRHPRWFRNLNVEREKLEKQAVLFNNEFSDAARVGIERYFVDRTMEEEMELVKREKAADQKKMSKVVVTSSDTSKKKDADDEESSKRTTNAVEMPPPSNFIM
ncbi:hypothetical protein PRIPAC_89821 [Pristionchus pacificus]|uniref:Uncharacterized protein n=1 Tax=Pristionchus pacificus TaxID=54126 RepID=A0A2A6CYP0_PRIPA|nr:hypothetical protein PRIPAC_89821 [Pristionchus pacificus]|eukprot:PDM83141.1 hypothetical protein PRIPAC_37534 [Pristionchus pacificus]